MILAYFVTAMLSNKSAETREWDPLACAPLNRPALAAIAGCGGMMRCWKAPLSSTPARRLAFLLFGFLQFHHLQALVGAAGGADEVRAMQVMAVRALHQVDGA